MAVAVRHPRRRHRRIPDPSIFRAWRPRTDAVQRITPGHLRHDRRGRGPRRTRGPLLVRQARGQEGIHHRRADAGREIAGTVDPPGLPSTEGQGGIGAVDAGRAVHHGHGGGMIGVTGHDFIGAGLGDDRDAARGRNAVAVAGRDVADTKENGALCFGRLQCVVVERVDVEFGGLVQRQMCRPDVDLGRGTRLSPKRVAGRDGIIQRRDAPAGLVGGVKRHGAQQKRGAADAGRGVGGRRLGVNHRAPWESRADCQSKSDGKRQGRGQHRGVASHRFSFWSWDTLSLPKLAEPWRSRQDRKLLSSFGWRFRDSRPRRPAPDGSCRGAWVCGGGIRKHQIGQVPLAIPPAAL